MVIVVFGRTDGCRCAPGAAASFRHVGRHSEGAVCIRLRRHAALGRWAAMPEALRKAIALTAEILAVIELPRRTPASAVPKTVRLAQLLNDQCAQAVFQYEDEGCPTKAGGFLPDV